MTESHGMNRRSAILAATAGAGAVMAGSLITSRAAAAEGATDETTKEKKVNIKTYQNNEFYKDGVFLADKATLAYYDMFDRFHYPITPGLKANMWAVDFAVGDFVHAGMAGIFWINQKEDKYFGHDIFLLPGQMIVEHCHVQTPDASPKMEGWHVRNGMIYTMGEGEKTDPLPFEIPESQKPFITVGHCTKLMPGEVDYLKRAEAKHFMMAGPEGAIVTEYATYHDGAALRFTNPKVKL